MANAVAAMNSSPTTSGKSGYPHAFQNFGKIVFSTDQCNRGYLLEFPVLQTGLYNAQKGHPKEDPGAARVIFIAENQPSPHKIFCGVVAHAGEGKNANKGHLQLCT